MKTQLVLENGSVYEGTSFGYETSVSGEVVFSTNMTGYPESLTDPSFCNQLLCLTYPLIGNYGIASTEEMDECNVLKHFESHKIWVSALLIANYSDTHSHYQSTQSLQTWLKNNRVPALYGIDTRRLTQELRTHGTLKGKIEFSTPIEFVNIHHKHLVKIVSTSEPYTLGNGNIHIAVVDCGIKLNIIRNLIHEGFKVTIVPYNYNFVDKHYDGIFISNGPGDPRVCVETIEHLRQYIQKNNAKPVFGICLGNQLLACAAGGSIYKMKYGNRGFNQPVFIPKYNKTFITSQNHGFAVDKKTLPSGWQEFCYNKNDQSNEGVYHVTKPFRSVQFHPEARGGPHDTLFMFKDFYDECCNYKYGKVQNNKIILLGSGGLSIGQAGEFDYSGSQAIKSFKTKGYQVILVNPNIATIQTCEGFADEVYYVPVTKEFVTDIIVKERPRYISLSFGGQTALNCGIELFESGILNQYNVEVLGTCVDSILKTEDRDLFSKAMTAIGEETPTSQPATTVQEAIKVANTIGYPVLVRAAFALGGLGSGFCQDEHELVSLLEKTFTKTSQVLIDEDLRGWKEVEYEVMRDIDGNSIIICNMENFDPLGIHTGDSIVVAPSQTLNNDEYNILRTASLRIANSLGIVGECNVQITLDPHSKRYKIIEVNPRLSRSSALASKATGYPIASVAAQLCLGEKLYAITNVVTGNTTANFEPSLDYVVVKVPRWDTLKFRGVDRHLGSAMKSVGEVMGIGRTFEEAFQKSLRMVCGHGFEAYGESPSLDCILDELKHPTDDRIRVLAHAILKQNMNMDDIYCHSKIDKWFLSKCFNIKRVYEHLATLSIETLTTIDLQQAKQMGYSDAQIANRLQCNASNVQYKREELGILCCMKQIDTLAGEYATQTNYLYSTYMGDSDDVCTTRCSDQSKRKIIVLGSGKYRIGSSVEFDYCSVKCTQYLREQGYETIMINYNPETMSTDFDNSDKLYFEELSFESVYSIYTREKAYGIVVSMGGQEPNNIAIQLHNAGLNIIGTYVSSIDSCENRFKYSSMLDRLGINQPRWISASSQEDIHSFVKNVQYPILVRPSYVLSGAAMQIVHNEEQLQSCMSLANDVSPDYPIVLTSFMEEAREVDVDAVAQKGQLVCYAISEHVENAGVHSGDATLILPSYSITDEQKKKMVDIIRTIGKELNISGLYNTQFLVKGDWVGVIETNLRASRSVPFVSKTLNIDFIHCAVLAMLDVPQEYIGTRDVNFFGVKSPQFSFNRLPSADPVLGVEMASTGEVACYGTTMEEAYMKSLVASRSGISRKEKQNILCLDDTDLSAYEEKGHCVLSYHASLDWKTVDMVIDCSNREDTRTLRRMAIDFSKCLVTNRQQVDLIARSISAYLSPQPYLYYKKSMSKRMVKLFIRQGFTESNGDDQLKLQSALDSVSNYRTAEKTFTLLTGNHAETKDSFKINFTKNHGKAFTPNNFREYRLDTLNDADAMIIFRTGLSESTVFEVAYNIFQGKKVPIFYAIEPGCEMKTTLLRELDGYFNTKVVYKVIEGGIQNITRDKDFIQFLDGL